MLRIETPARNEVWDETNECFLTFPSQHLIMEHSLLSVAKWESHWCVPFFSPDDKSVEQWVDYFRCMTVNIASVDPRSFYAFDKKTYDTIIDYIAKPQTATTFAEDRFKRPNSRQHIETSETIYYSMAVLGIPFECEKWHLSRLMALIRVGEIRSGGSKSQNRKMTAQEQSAMYAQINEQRRRQYHTRG